MKAVSCAWAASPLQKPHHVRFHAAQSDHAHSHVIFLSLVRRIVRFTQMSDCPKTKPTMQRTFTSAPPPAYKSKRVSGLKMLR